MKYCAKCGKELLDEAVMCPGCGCAVGSKNQVAEEKTTPTQKSPKAATVLGIIGIISAWLFALVGHITSVIGIIMGIKEYKQTGKITGLTLSIIGEVCAIFSSIIGAVAFSGL